MIINREEVFRIVKVNVPCEPEWRGYFHEWTGTSEYCLAIVETDNGFLKQIYLDYIQFII